jgi:hypothetical protein
MFVRADAVPSSEKPDASISSSSSSSRADGRSSLDVDGIEDPGKGELGCRW